MNSKNEISRIIDKYIGQYNAKYIDNCVDKNTDNYI